MDILKVQQEVLKALIKDQKGSYFHTDDDRVFLTVDGTVGYFIDTADLQLNLIQAQSMLPLNLEEIVNPRNLLVGTDEYRIEGTVRKYQRADGAVGNIYVATAKLKHFDAPRLYQAPNAKSVIVVTEDLNIYGETRIVGMVMPYFIKEN